MLFFPYQFDVPMQRWPFANFAIMAVTIFVSMAALSQEGDHFGAYEPLVLDGWNPVGVFGSALLHGDLIHLIGNMVFLWVFGNAICAKIGNLWYVLVYVLLAGAASVVHNIFDGMPAIGASGAINGVIGMALIWYPANSVSCVWWFLRYGGTFDIDCRFLVAIWLAFDILGVAVGGGMTAYWAHIGGIAAGAALAVMLLKQGWVTMDETEHSIFELFRGKRGMEEDKQARDRRRQAAVLGSAAIPREYRTEAPSPPPLPHAAERSTERQGDEAGSTGMAEAVKVRCRCGGRFRVGAEHLGRMARCPKCSEPVRIEPAE